VQDQFRPAARAGARGGIGKATRDEFETLPLRRTDPCLNLIEVAPMARSKVVQTNHALLSLQQGFQQIRANETGHADNQPGARRALQTAAEARALDGGEGDT
jgi:hypothetical protein